MSDGAARGTGGGRGTSGVAGVGLAIALASAAGYVLLALVGRELTPADFGLFVAFWGVLFGLGGSLSTVEQESARQRSAAVPEPGPSLPAITTASAVLAAAGAALTLLPPVAARLYGDPDSRLGVVVVLAAVGFAVQFALRGVLIGSGRVRDYGGLVVLEAAVRLVVLLAVLVTVGVTLTTAAVAVGLGSFAWLGWAGRARLSRAHGEPDGAAAGHGWWPAVRRSASLMLAAALTASVVTGYPTMVAALTGSPPGDAGGAVFAALTVSRVPLLLVSPLQALAVPAVVRWRGAAGGGSTLLRQRLLLGTGAFAALGLVGGVAGWLLGPWAVRLVYGPAYDVSPAAVALLVMSAFLLAWVLLLSAALVALAAYRSMIAMWVTAVAGTAVWLVLSPWGVVETTAVGAVVGPVAATACAIPLLWRITAPSASAAAPTAGGSGPAT
ncbi:hypothetical protein [Cellulomonas aerilata]|uniref:Polysaccharide biosynthesis protein n=1 Tax=Cellulomonas aerilata TaxID=515326 RepID=A0A512DDA1_9CELL|nr:hypothetical protein [Cellulomonas aerilata]GEO34454.1 hypothetical protein CAE01nite_21790 [Cellulomonas aerilata]